MSKLGNLRLSLEVANFAQTNSKLWLPCETGGIVIGRRTGCTYEVSHLIGPGSNAIHAEFRFLRDGDYSQKQLDEIFDDSNGMLTYIGEWHSHPACVGPSTTDTISILANARDPRYAQESPVLLLLIRCLKRWYFQGFAVRDQRVVRISVEIVNVGTLFKHTELADDPMHEKEPGR